MTLRVSSFFFKKVALQQTAPQRAITKAEVETPGAANSTNIVGLYPLELNKDNLDPNSLVLYGAWPGTPEAYGTHDGALSDNLFGKYLDGYGIQKNGWAAGPLDTYFNADGISFSWIQRLTPVLNARLLQYWQADLEFIELYCLDTDTLELAVCLGTGTLKTNATLIDDFNAADGAFHHYLVSFNPSGDRICRLYIDGVLAATTLAVTGPELFGNEAVNIRRGISFGASYTATDTNPSGDVDHCVILVGAFTPEAQFFDNKMIHETIYMKYFGSQMTYNPV